MNSYTHQYSYKSLLKAPRIEAFDYLDDPKKLSTHMEKSSWMMAGSQMEMELDAKQGREIGSIIRLSGKMMGIPLFVQEHVTKRIPHQEKEWETFGEQKMLIIEQYKMGFKLNDINGNTEIEVYIEYSLPKKQSFGILTDFLAKKYAKWCTQRMAHDAAAHFAS